MTEKQEIYFQIRYDKRITDYSRLSKEENITEEEAKKKYKDKGIDGYICEKIGETLNVSIDKKELREIKKYFNEYHELYNKYYNKKREELFKDPEELVKWFQKQDYKCGYCLITQGELNIIVKKRGGNLTLNNLTKRSKGTLEIEKKDSNDVYAFDKIILACPLCNNAKSNLIHADDWIVTFVNPMRKHYEKLLEEELKFQLPE